jgi:acyl carrier protein
MNVEGQFGIEFDVATIFSFRSVADLVTAVEVRIACLDP